MASEKPQFVAFRGIDAKELIQELKSISKMLQPLHSSLKKL
jgi:predicted RNA-binding protein with EMAP domain